VKRSVESPCNRGEQTSGLQQSVNAIASSNYQDWVAGSYVVRVAAELEDLAGNRLTRLFDEPVKPDGRRAEAREVVLRFRIGR
jgi:hypothetical protein